MGKTIYIEEEEFELFENDSTSIPYRLYNVYRKKNFFAHNTAGNNYAILDWYGRKYTEIEKAILDRKRAKDEYTANWPSGQILIPFEDKNSTWSLTEVKSDMPTLKYPMPNFRQTTTWLEAYRFLTTIVIDSLGFASMKYPTHQEIDEYLRSNEYRSNP